MSSSNSSKCGQCQHGGTCDEVTGLCGCLASYGGTHCEAKRCLLSNSNVPNNPNDDDNGNIININAINVKNDGQVLCYNDGECVLDWDAQDQLFFKCVCPLITHGSYGEVQKVSGGSCEYVDSATTMCVVASEVSDLISTNAFCTNGGECRKIITNGSDVFEGCICKQGFTGPHCEFSEVEVVGNKYNDMDGTKPSLNENKPMLSSTTKTLGADAIFLIAVGSVAMAILMVMQYRRNRRKQFVAGNLLNTLGDAYTSEAYEDDDEDRDLSIPRIPPAAYHSNFSSSSVDGSGSGSGSKSIGTKRSKASTRLREEMEFGSRNALREDLDLNLGRSSAHIV